MEKTIDRNGPEKISFWKKVITNLTFYVLIAIIAGILTGHYAPDAGVKMKAFGDGFISLVKLFIGPIIFLTIVLGISTMGDLRKVGRIGLKSLVYFEIVTTFALIIGVVAAYMVRPGEVDRAGLDIQDAGRYTSRADTGFDWWQFFLNNFTLQVLVAAMICGIILNKMPKKKRVLEALYFCSRYIFRALRYVMYLAPLGAFGGMAYTIGRFGLHTLIPLGKLMLTVYLTMAVFIFGVLGAIMRYYRESIFRFLKNIQAELLIVLGTSSSEPALPGLMEKLEKMGCPRSVVGLVVPTGYSFNLDGTSIYLSMAVIFLAQLYNVHLNPGEIVYIIGLLMLTSKGAAGVTGSGFIVLASTLTAIHKIPVEGLAFLLGVDKFMSEARAITNCIGNGVAAIVISRHEAGDKAEEDIPLE